MEPICRCRWCNPRNPLYVAYHDQEWGAPQYDDGKLFELLVLESFQAGLSWETILNKRESFRSAFGGFIPERVAAYGETETAALLENKSIVRNRRKIAAAVQNARVFLEIQREWGSFSRYIWHFTDGQVVYDRRGQLPVVGPGVGGPETAGHDLCGHHHRLRLLAGHRRDQLP